MNPLSQASNELPDIDMFRIFARLHPIEAYHTWPIEFCEFMRNEGYNLTDEEIKELINKIDINEI